MGYTDEKNVQIVISLLKQHGIRKVIASPGATNVTFVRSIQSDSWFEIYSSIDERSAAYMACGLAAESGEHVVINCTGATSSRNYMPGLTEAFYRKLPIIAITSSRESHQIGHIFDQVTDRSTPPKDTAKSSVQIPIVKDDEDIWNCEIKVNKAILESTRNGGGPVHLNVETRYSGNYETIELPLYRKIERITCNDDFPQLPSGKIAIYIGSHVNMSEMQVKNIEKFCELHNAVAFCTHSSNYYGKYSIRFSLAEIQSALDKSTYTPDYVIHIGEIREYPNNQLHVNREVWRVNPDGEIRDTYRKLKYVFEMPIENFFERYSIDQPNSANNDNSYFKLCGDCLSKIRSNTREIPFSNIWVASQLAPNLPPNSTIHFGILNSLRSWNLFDLPHSIRSMSNVGGFGIDGGMSSLIGASLFNPDKLYYLVIGDLAFFYDINVLGNRHLGHNVRILLINNGLGKEFTLHKSQQLNAAITNEYVGAAGHNGNKSQILIKNFAENLGCEYLTASNKEEFAKIYERFITPKLTDKPIVFEVFTDSIDETDAYNIMKNLDSSASGKLKKVISNVIGKNGVKTVKSLLGK